MMGKDEILVEFRQARDKAAQIEILADLNAVAPRAIAKIIDEAGELEPEGLFVKSFSPKYDPIQPAAPRKRAYNKDFDQKKARELFDEGKTDEAIADQLNVPIYRIQVWRAENNLRRDYSWRKDSTLEFKPKEGKRMKKSKAAEPEEFPLPPAKLSDDKDGPMTINKLWAAMRRVMTQDVMGAELRINGRADVDMYGYEVKVRNDHVYVDLYLLPREGAGA